MANLSDQKGFKGFLPVIGLCLACFSIGLAISWYLMNSHYLRVKLDCEKAEINLGEVSKDLGRVKVENDGLRKLVRDKDDIINKLKAKGPENIENEIKLKEEEITNVKNELGAKQKELDQAKKENIGSSDNLSKVQKELETIKASFEEYRNKYPERPQATNVSKNQQSSDIEYKMIKGSVLRHQTSNFFNNSLSICVSDFKNKKIDDLIIASQGYPSLRLNNKVEGDKISYDAAESYEITIDHISNQVVFVILQKKKMR